MAKGRRVNMRSFKLAIDVMWSFDVTLRRRNSPSWCSMHSAPGKKRSPSFQKWESGDSQISGKQVLAVTVDRLQRPESWNEANVVVVYTLNQQK